MPTVHVFKTRRVMAVSVATGVMQVHALRMVSNRFEFDGPLVDSMTVHSSDTLEFANLVFQIRQSLSSSSTPWPRSCHSPRGRPTSG